MSKNNPTHPGESVLLDCIEPLGLTVTSAAKVLGVSRRTLSNVVTRKGGITAEMAVRLEKAFGSTAEMWLRLQAAHDLAEVKKRANSIKVKRVRRPVA